MSISFIVGGVSYTVQESILASYQDSFFGRMLKEEWRPAHNEPVVIDRDGTLFRHVIDFMTYKCLPRNKKLQCLLDKETLVALLDEADYFQLSDMTQDINELRHYPEMEIVKCHKHVTEIVQKYVWECTPFNCRGGMFHIVSHSEVVDALQPFYGLSCVRGTYHPSSRRQIYKSSTTYNLNIEELLADATPSHFGRNSETVFDRSVRNSLEIKAEHLNAETLQCIAAYIELNKMSRTMILEARPYKLVIYPEGGHFAPHRDTVRGDNHVGTAVYILSNHFTGGELLVHSGGETMMVKRPGEWIAMFGDCMHEIRPVRSGVRVTLVYDIYCTGQRYLGDDDDDLDEQEEEEEEYDEYVEKAPVDGLAVDAISEQDERKLIAACRRVISPFCIALQHLYPKSQSTMHFLKGGDRILFDTLSEHFDVQLVPILHCRTKYFDPKEEFTGFAIFDGISEYDEQRVKYCGGGKNQLLPLFTLEKKHRVGSLIFQKDYIEYTGNDARPEQSAYLMHGLFVAPKV